jgi:hypothetical protein
MGIMRRLVATGLACLALMVGVDIAPAHAQFGMPAIGGLPKWPCRAAIRRARRAQAAQAAQNPPPCIVINVTYNITVVSQSTGQTVTGGANVPVVQFGSTTAPNDRGWQVAPQAGGTEAGLDLSINSEFALTHFEGGNTFALAAGPRLTRFDNGRFALYGQVLAGFLRDTGFTDFLLQPGGGVLVRLPGQRFLLTAGVDFPIDFFEGGRQTGKRFGGGIAIPLTR